MKYVLFFCIITSFVFTKKMKTEHEPEPISTFIGDALNRHNNWRSIHGVPNLSLNDDLTRIAQEWADNLAKAGNLNSSGNRYQGNPLG